MAPGYLAQDQSLSMRRNVFAAAYEFFTSSPVFGIGTGNFIHKVGMSAENMYMHMLAEEGLFVTMAFVGAIVLLWLKLKKVHRGQNNLFYKVYSTIILVYLLSSCIHPTQYEVLGYLLLGAAFSNFMLLRQSEKTVKCNAILISDMDNLVSGGQLETL
jgi:O-antigen ligase